MTYLIVNKLFAKDIAFMDFEYLIAFYINLALNRVQTRPTERILSISKFQIDSQAQRRPR